MPLILGTNSIKDTGFDVANSVRLNDGSSDYFNRTPGSATNQKTFTISMWVKRSELGATNGLLLQGVNTGNDDFSIYFEAADSISLFSWSGSSEQFTLNTNRKFRDVSAWYHIVVAVDTTQGTAADRVKLYINGVQETSFATANYPSVNADLEYNDTSVLWVGRGYGGTTFDGYMSEVVSIDGTALDPTSFGEFDEDSGIWKPIDVSGLTFGNNGFYLDFESSGSLGNDVSGNDNDFTVNNLTAIDQSTDTCTNNFATWNPLDNYYAESTFKEGNLEVRGKSPGTIYGYETYNLATIGVSSGKWYWEIKISARDNGATEIGITDSSPTASSQQLQQGTYAWSYKASGSVVNNNSSVSGSWSSYTTGDIIGIALNLDDNELTFYKNGTVQNSGTAISITAPASTSNGFYFPAGGDENAGNVTLQANFGSPIYSISSGNTDGNGYGNFEYAVPSGYYSLNTKNLAEYG